MVCLFQPSEKCLGFSYLFTLVCWSGRKYHQEHIVPYKFGRKTYLMTEEILGNHKMKREKSTLEILFSFRFYSFTVYETRNKTDVWRDEKPPQILFQQYLMPLKCCPSRIHRQWLFCNLFPKHAGGDCVCVRKSSRLVFLITYLHFS